MTQRLSIRHAHGLELEVYVVFNDGHGSETAIHELRAQIEQQSEIRLEVFQQPDAPPHAARFNLDADPRPALQALQAALHANSLRWLEIGLRGYGVIEGKREHRPWRRNAYLNLEQFLILEVLEPEVRYHAPA